MSLAQLTISPQDATPILSGTTRTFTATTAGLLAAFNGSAIAWTNLTGCQVLAGNLLRDNAAGGNSWDVAGATSTAQTASGEAFAEFVAATPQSLPGYPAFGGRAFFAGLTSKTTALYADLDFGIMLSENTLAIVENGVARRNLLTPKVNGVYRVGIEDGQVIYRENGRVIYRSDQPIVYPVRFGARFYHRGSDQIGGTPSGTVNWFCFGETGAIVPAFTGNTFTAPTNRGRYRVVAETADYLYGETYVDVRRRYPDEFTVNGFPCASKFLPLQPDWAVKTQEFDDKAIATSLPYPTVEPKRVWQLEYNGLPNNLWNVLDVFASEHKNNAYPFFFYDKRIETLFDNCRITKYERSHRKAWLQTRRVEVTYTPR